VEEGGKKGRERARRSRREEEEEERTEQAGSSWRDKMDAVEVRMEQESHWMY
jgi:hypothetical protein